MRSIDYTPFYRSTVGFDRLFSLLEDSSRLAAAGPHYPPYNIQRTGEDSYRIEIAVAGFGPEDLSITAEQDVVTVTGRKQPAEAGQFLHQGVAGRSFTRQFHLADYIKVTGADLVNGMLQIDLVREVPEAMKPRRIMIGAGDPPMKMVDQKAA